MPDAVLGAMVASYTKANGTVTPTDRRRSSLDRQVVQDGIKKPGPPQLLGWLPLMVPPVQSTVPSS